MDKKDIYEHLANIYLDASLKKKNKAKEHQAVKGLFFLSLAVIFGLSGILITVLRKKEPLNTEVALVLLPEAAKINFHFNPAKKETYTINLNKLDLSQYKTLGFSAKKSFYADKLSLRIELASIFREASEIYIRDIPVKWQDYKIELPNFKKISDWSEMVRLSFIVEEWNVGEKKGVVYIDNVRFLK
ncbi:MAG: hypothetical protein HZC16_04085 [Candidatus Omnitrophica bacterium]|nr:hypothetical protein [Candidatus Omnitrophota bacterium]